MNDVDLADQLAREAGSLLLGIRDSGTSGRPLGQRGDSESNLLLLTRLSAERPQDAVLSEESVDDLARLNAERVWIIDPLDGTREFGLRGRTDWAVHIALWEARRGLTAAAVAQPALWIVCSTQSARGCAKQGGRTRIVVSDTRPPAFVQRVAVSIDADVLPMGSAGAKTMSVLRGHADAYVHAGGQWEWDSAAPVVVALAGGLHACRIDGSTLKYNQSHPHLPDLLICRPELAESLLEAIAEAA